MISQDHVIKRSYDCIGRGSSLYITTFQRFLTIKFVLVEIYWMLVAYSFCHVTLQDHVTKESFDFMVGSPSRVVTTSVTIGLMVM